MRGLFELAVALFFASGRDKRISLLRSPHIDKSPSLEQIATPNKIGSLATKLETRLKEAREKIEVAEGRLNKYGPDSTTFDSEPTMTA